MRATTASTSACVTRKCCRDLFPCARPRRARLLACEKVWKHGCGRPHRERAGRTAWAGRGAHAAAQRAGGGVDCWTTVRSNLCPIHPAAIIHLPEVSTSRRPSQRKGTRTRGGGYTRQQRCSSSRCSMRILSCETVWGVDAHVWNVQMCKTATVGCLWPLLTQKLYTRARVLKADVLFLRTATTLGNMQRRGGTHMDAHIISRPFHLACRLTSSTTESKQWGKRAYLVVVPSTPQRSNPVRPCPAAVLELLPPPPHCRF
eukprot:40843-Chlamydomonas_euryale.AAC.2